MDELFTPCSDMVRSQAVRTEMKRILVFRVLVFRILGGVSGKLRPKT